MICGASSERYTFLCIQEDDHNSLCGQAGPQNHPDTQKTRYPRKLLVNNHVPY